MKKGIFILAALLAISCGKKGNTTGNSDQNNAEIVQAPAQPKVISDDEYLKSMAIKYSGSDSYGTGLNCTYEQNLEKYNKCEYNIQNSQNNGHYSIELSPKGIFKINKTNVKMHYECNEYPECSEDSKYTCKVSNKDLENKDSICDIFGIDYGFIHTLNDKTIFLKSEISYYRFIFSSNY